MESNKNNFPDVGKKEINRLDLLNKNIVSVNTQLKNIVNGFYHVGRILSALQSNELFKEKGYKNFVEFTKAEFNLSSTQTYSLIKIFNKFPSEKYSDFTFSQLSEMLSLPDEKIEKINPDMTIKQIREVKKQDKQDKQDKKVDNETVIKKKGLPDFDGQIDAFDAIVIEENKKDNFAKSIDAVEGFEVANKILKSRLEASDGKLVKQSSLIRDKNKELENLKAKLKDLENSNSSLSAKVIDLQHKNDELVSENNCLKESIKLLKQKKTTRATKTVKKNDIKKEVE